MAKLLATTTRYVKLLPKGEDAVTYEIAPDVGVIKVGASGSVTPARISLTVTRVCGAEREIIGTSCAEGKVEVKASYRRSSGDATVVLSFSAGFWTAYTEACDIIPVVYVNGAEVCRCTIPAIEQPQEATYLKYVFTESEETPAAPIGDTPDASALEPIGKWKDAPDRAYDENGRQVKWWSSVREFRGLTPTSGTWSPPLPCTGSDGKDAEHPDFKYCIWYSATTAPLRPAVTVTGGGGEVGGGVIHQAAMRPSVADWQDDPPTPTVDNPFVWMTVGKVENGVVVSWSAPVCLTGSRGEDGVTYRFTLSDHHIYRNADGIATPGSVTIKAMCQRGAQKPQPVSDDEATINVTITTPDGFTETHSVSNGCVWEIDAVSDEKDTTKVELVVDGVVVAQDSWELHEYVKPYTNWKIVPSTSAIVRNTDGTVTPASITLSVRKTTNGNVETITAEEWSNIYIKAEMRRGTVAMSRQFVPDSEGNFETLTIEPLATDAGYTLSLYVGGAVFDRVTIPFIPHGAQGLTGQGWKNAGQWRNDVNYYWDSEADIPVRPYVWMPIEGADDWETNTGSRKYYYRDTTAGDCMGIDPSVDAVENGTARHWREFDANYTTMVAQLIQAEDIDAERIIARQVRVRDTSGNILCSIDGQTGRIIAGDQQTSIDGQPAGTGQRVEIDPSTKSVTVYDSDGNQCISIDGDKVDSIGSFFGGTTGNVAISPASSDYVAARPTAETVYLSDAVGVSQGTVVKVSGTLGSKCNSISNNTTSIIGNIPVTNTVTLQTVVIVDFCKDKGCAQLIASKTVANYSHTFGQVDVLRTHSSGFSSTATAPQNCYMRMRLQYSLTTGGRGGTGSVNWQGIAASFVSDMYAARMFGNGVIFSKSADNYFAALADSQGMTVEARSGESGIRVSNGRYYQYAGTLGAWSPFPRHLMSGVLTPDFSTYGCGISVLTIDGYSFDNTPSDPTATAGRFKLSTTSGEYLIRFPTDWAQLGLSSKLIVKASSNLHTVVDGVTDKDVTIKTYNSAGTQEKCQRLTVELTMI